MNIEEAIKTALEYETKVRNVYIDAMKKVEDDAGKKIFNTMAKEEQGHLDYLNDRLNHWNETGKLDAPTLKTIVPSKEAIEEGVRKLEKNLDRKSRDAEIDLLQKALEVETETSSFYRKMVEDLPDEGKAMFSRFLEIEEGHQAIVQAEISALSGNGYWFDFSDINLEMA